MSNILLAVVFGTAIGNLVRGVPLDGSGAFYMAFFTDFRARGHVGLLDWYTLSVGIFALVLLSAHGATYLNLKTDGAVYDRGEQLMRILWVGVFAGLVAVSFETWFVRLEFFETILHRPLAWVGIGVVLFGSAAILSGIRSRMEFRAFAGSCLFIAGLLGVGAVSIFPVMLSSTLAPEYSLTAYNSAASRASLAVAAIWWPIALVLAVGYFVFILRYFRGKVKPSGETQGFY